MKSISLIKEIQRREKERGCYDDDIQALEGKVEELGTSLAETRYLHLYIGWYLDIAHVWMLVIHIQL